MRIAIAGGTGTVGRHVVAAAQERGHDVVVLSRSTGADVISGAGLDDALAGADAMIDVSNTVTLSARKSREFFSTGTRNLLAAEQRTGVAHHVALSIVGIDGLDAAYYSGKLAQERAVAAGPVPHTIARVAQFHEFAGQILSMTGGPVAIVPRMLTRPVAAREVGAHLVALAESTPSARAIDLVGPRDEVLADLARRQLAHDGTRRRVWEVRLPGRYGAGLASGSLRGTDARIEGRIAFDEWLDGEDHGRP